MPIITAMDAWRAQFGHGWRPIAGHPEAARYKSPAGSANPASEAGHKNSARKLLDPAPIRSRRHPLDRSYFARELHSETLEHAGHNAARAAREISLAWPRH